LPSKKYDKRAALGVLFYHKSNPNYKCSLLVFILWRLSDRTLFMAPLHQGLRTVQAARNEEVRLPVTCYANKAAYQICSSVYI